VVHDPVGVDTTPRLAARAEARLLVTPDPVVRSRLPGVDMAAANVRLQRAGAGRAAVVSLCPGP
jgi:hypothetical protein